MHQLRLQYSYAVFSEDLALPDLKRDLCLVCRPPPVVTKGDVDAEKERLKIQEAQPIKKIQEAKARKKKRLQVTKPLCHFPLNQTLLTIKERIATGRLPCVKI
jgi:hypothetical protein